MTNRVGPKTELPCPRLELRWTKSGESWVDRVCTYSLVFPLRAYDRRANTDDSASTVETEAFLEISTTKVSGGRDGEPATDDEPFRDGIHAQWDAAALNLPIVIIVGDKHQIIPQREMPRPVEYNRWLKRIADTLGVTYEQLMEAGQKAYETDSPVPYNGTLSEEEFERVIEDEFESYDFWSSWSDETHTEFDNDGSTCCPEYNYPNHLYIWK